MKRFDFPIDTYQAEWMFTAIRSKRDTMLLLMRTIKIMLLPPIPNPGAVGKVILLVDKMSRLFFVLDSKIFSINFPYVVIEDHDKLTFRSINHSEINSSVTSSVLSLLETSDALDNREVLHFAEPISDISQYDEDFWSMFRELLMYEDGYVRFDHDEERANGHLHPVDHLDVFYTTGSTFKLGLLGNISHDHFLDVLNLNSNCHYLSPAR